MTLSEITYFVLEWVKSLESQVQEVLDASLPNKQQHKAATRIIHDKFRVALNHLEQKLDKRD